MNIKNFVYETVKDSVDVAESLPWGEEGFYKSYLAQTYFYVCHSVPLLEYAYKKAQGPIKERLKEHISEEAGHERMAESDLGYFGDSLNDYSENEETKSMYDYVYQAIDEHGPIAIFAYALSLETLSKLACPKIATKLIDTYDKKASSFIYHHGVLDQEHVDDGVSELQGLSKEDEVAFKEVYEASVRNYLNFTSAILEKYHKFAA